MLRPCPDCNHQVSIHAEACPQCGSFFQTLRHGQQIDRTGWATTIAYGVLLGSIITVLIGGIGIVILFFLGAAAMMPHVPATR